MSQFLVLLAGNHLNDKAVMALANALQMRKQELPSSELVLLHLDDNEFGDQGATVGANPERMIMLN